MKLELEVFNALCETRIFKINGVRASYEDFGDKYDRQGCGAELYSCGDMRFTRVSPRQEILDKYHITESEYYEVCSELEDKLSFGSCGWCV